MRSGLTSRIVWLLGLWLVLSGCAPAVQPAAVQVVHLTFSADAWGGLPFTAEARQRTMVQAVLDRRVERLEQAVATTVDAQPASVLLSVQGFTAFFEVDARSGLPIVSSGYQLELHLAQGAPTVHARLTNRATGITRGLRLDPARLP
ncbi:MAG: hypothetical protein KGZ60_10980 [Truepera sp.]|nr:hypothetical protein [Truepera sp.]